MILFAVMEPEEGDVHNVFVDETLMSPGSEDYNPRQISRDRDLSRIAWRGSTVHSRGGRQFRYARLLPIAAPGPLHGANRSRRRAGTRRSSRSEARSGALRRNDADTGWIQPGQKTSS
jgi:hypothetical protein